MKLRKRLDLEEIKEKQLYIKLREDMFPLFKHAPQRNYDKIIKKTKFQKLNYVRRFT